MTTTVLTPTADQWDRFVEKENGHLLQTSKWGELKKAFGWTYEIAAVVDEQDAITAGALILYRALPLKLGKIAYVPRGPVVQGDDEVLLESLLNALHARATKNGAILLKIEPDWDDTPANRTRLQTLGFRESVQTIQPPRTIMVDISGERGEIEGDGDAVLMQMSGTTRRKVRQGARKGIVIHEVQKAELDAFSDMMLVTGARNVFGVHSLEYYQKAFDEFVPEDAALLMASYEGEAVAGLFAFACGNRAWYLYGASSNKHRNLMPTYILQWAAMEWARDRGCEVYDMWGIPDEDEETLEAHFKDRNDGLWGVYGFKRGFGGEVVRSVGAWDKPYKPVMYKLYELAMRIR